MLRSTDFENESTVRIVWVFLMIKFLTKSII